MDNPFDILLRKLDQIEEKIDTLEKKKKAAPEPEIIDTKILLKRLAISRPTEIRWRRKGKIPYFMVGSSVRYDWNKVKENFK